MADENELEDDGIMEDSQEKEMERITRDLCKKIKSISDGLVKLNKATELCCQFQKNYKLHIHIGESVSSRLFHCHVLLLTFSIIVFYVQS